jgi:hypothetical protein
MWKQHFELTSRQFNETILKILDVLDVLGLNPCFQVLDLGQSRGVSSGGKLPEFTDDVGSYSYPN